MTKHPECGSKHHPSHVEQLPRLNRIAGQVDGVKKMIQEKRYCPDILTQLHAIRSAVRNLEIQILDTHLSHCVTDVFQKKNQVKQKIEEIRTLIKRFN